MEKNKATAVKIGMTDHSRLYDILREYDALLENGAEATDFWKQQISPIINRLPSAQRMAEVRRRAMIGAGEYR